MYPRRAKRTAVSGSISRYFATTSGPTNGSCSGNSNRLQVWQSGPGNRSVPVTALRFWPLQSNRPGFSEDLLFEAGDSQPCSRAEGALEPPEICRCLGIQVDDKGSQD